MKRGKMKKDWFKHHAECGTRCHCNQACSSGIYFIGFIGAAIYYVQTSTSFWNGVFGVLKAMIWPAFLVYKLLGF